MVELSTIQEKLPVRFNLPQKVANRLNERGIKSLYGKAYTYHSVRACFKNGSDDSNVLNEALDILAEHKDQKARTQRKASKIINN